MPASDNNSTIYGQGWGAALQDLALPSGAICQLRKLQMEDLVELGIMDQVDFLSQIVEEKHVERVKKPSDRAKKQPTKAEAAEAAKVAEQEQTAALLRDPKKFSTMSAMIDKIVVACVIKPQIVNGFREVEEGQRIRLDDDARVHGVIYSDSIPFGDKMEVFEVAFAGVQKMSSFRGESAEDVGHVDSVEGDALPAE